MSEVGSPVISEQSWLQPGEVLIHVGPRKTGSSTVQEALALADDNLRSLGFFLAPKVVDGSRAAQGALFKKRRQLWRTATDVVKQRGPQDRGLVSEEMLHRLDLQQAERVVKTLGGPDQVRILITNRPLTKAMPSLWQQLVKTGFTSDSLSDWLTNLLEHPDSPDWRSQRLDRYYDHWSQVVPVDRIAILPVGYGPGDLLLEFEQLTGIPENYLDRRTSNTSLTAEQAEMMRIRNKELAKADVHLRRHKLNRPPLGKRKHGTSIVLPEWARPQVSAIQAELTENIIAREAFVLGGAERLRLLPELPPEIPLSDSAIEFARFAGRYVANVIEISSNQPEG
ncbi:MAG: hypothetical protein K0U60_08890 [Actinomycetia bacterium]|nr:hypothetical protein [Actinomycetes bacterium]MCH9800732.1 hypothetical protein [Actinomycetes bacterium]